MKMSREESAAFIQRMTDDMQPILRQSTITNYGNCDNHAEPLGIGTLFRVANRSFLVTSHSILRGKTERNPYLPTERTACIELREPAIQDKLHGIVVWELSQDVAANLSDCTFLHPRHMDHGLRTGKPGWFMLYHSSSIPPITMGAVLATDPNTVFSGYDPDVHLLLKVMDAKCQSSDSDRVELFLRLCDGNGASVWQSFLQGLDARFWTRNDARVVGVLTGVASMQGAIYLTGTRWFVVEELLRQHYPELRDVLEVVVPYRRATEESAHG